MLAWNSRAHNIRIGLLAPRINKARAIPQDFAPPRPPRQTLYRAFLNSPCNLTGNSAFAMAFSIVGVCSIGRHKGYLDASKCGAVLAGDFLFDLVAPAQNVLGREDGKRAVVSARYRAFHQVCFL